MKAILYMGAACCGLAVAAPLVMNNASESGATFEDAPKLSSLKRSGSKSNAVRRPVRLNGQARAFRDNRGHFNFKARLNGRNVKVLVDTGASSVAINRSTARRIGIRLKPTDFKYTANTANGQTKFARATIKEIRIDGVMVRNVKAAVLDDRSLSDTLLGMSFLGKLSSFEIKGRTLTLRQ